MVLTFRWLISLSQKPAVKDFSITSSTQLNTQSGFWWSVHVLEFFGVNLNLVKFVKKKKTNIKQKNIIKYMSDTRILIID